MGNSISDFSAEGYTLENVLVGVKDEGELKTLLDTLVGDGGLCSKFSEKVTDFSGRFSSPAELWSGKDADAFYTEITKPNGVLDQINTYAAQVNQLKELATSLRNAIEEGQAKIAQTIDPTIEGGN